MPDRSVSGPTPSSCRAGPGLEGRVGAGPTQGSRALPLLTMSRKPPGFLIPVATLVSIILPVAPSVFRPLGSFQTRGKAQMPFHASIYSSVPPPPPPHSNLCLLLPGPLGCWPCPSRLQKCERSAAEWGSYFGDRQLISPRPDFIRIGRRLTASDAAHTESSLSAPQLVIL